MSAQKDVRSQRKNGIVLSGGGARGAFQAGVVKGLAKISEDKNLQFPFDIITGVSAGAINASYLASTVHEFYTSMRGLAHFWSTITTKQVFHSDFASLGKTGIRWIWDLAAGGIKRDTNIKALLDTQPLRQLLRAKIPFEFLSRNIHRGLIQAVEITALNYATSESVSFVQTDDPSLQWVRAKRRSMQVLLGIDHIMASSALPIVFPPIRIGNLYYGDGSLRNTAPLSASIQLGAEKLFVVGVRKEQEEAKEYNYQTSVKPSLGRVLSVLLNGVLLDAFETDFERVQRMNKTINYISSEKLKEVDLVHIDLFSLKPSEDIGDFAKTQFERLPDSIKYLLRGLGSPNEASELVSYLLFEPEYCGYLVNMGYKDTLAKKDEILDFLLR